jgi:hypothetical protein
MGLCPRFNASGPSKFQQVMDIPKTKNNDNADDKAWNLHGKALERLNASDLIS